MNPPIRYFVNPKTRMCQMLSGPATGVEHLANISQALKDGFVEVANAEALEAFRDVTRDAKSKGWNPDRIRYSTWLKKQAPAL
jgi:hypothetical protein